MHIYIYIYMIFVAIYIYMSIYLSFFVSAVCPFAAANFAFFSFPPPSPLIFK